MPSQYCLQLPSDVNAIRPKWQAIRLFHSVRAIVGGRGPPVILLPGWPQTAEAFSDIFEALSKHYQFFALDPPGLGDSPDPLNGYDTANVNCLSLAHPIPTKNQIAQPTCVWQFSFNALPELPEILTSGREPELLTWFFNLKTVLADGLSKDHFERYIQAYSRPGAMSRGFEYYRAFATSAKQNLEYARTPLGIPVLALGGASSVGAGMVHLAQHFATNVSGGAVDDCGHFFPEEQPFVVAQRLLEFFAANRE